MRIIVILSPTGKRGTKCEYTKLRKALSADGFINLNADVYMRVATGNKGAEKHFRRLESVAPKSGTVRAFTLTEKQYARIHYASGAPDLQEKIVGANCHIAL